MSDNPFEVTKAVDFTDAEIAKNWVDLGAGGFTSLADPSGSMPRFLVGGKGGGRTHVMRYFSSDLQLLRHQEDALQGLQSEGFIGIYFRCGGLNARRFQGKGIEPEAWSAVFAYYMDLWLAQQVIQVLDRIQVATSHWAPPTIAVFVAEVSGLFSADGGPSSLEVPLTLVGLSQSLQARQKAMDKAVNNAALTRRLDVAIESNPGDLVFDVPRIAQLRLPGLESLHFTYLVDEFENLDAEQQRYINTLIREKRLPSNFIVGSRQYGLRTMSTYAAGEENKIGSEYDLVVLEDAYRGNGEAYSRFCRSLIRRRLSGAGYREFSDPELKGFFEQLPASPLMSEASRRVVSNVDPLSRPHLRRAREVLEQAGVPSGSTDSLLDRLLFPGEPLVEKFATMLMYRMLAEKEKPSTAVGFASTEAQKVVLMAGAGKRPESSAWRHYRDDLFAQLLYENKQSQNYYGVDRFIDLSGYLPRNVLIILKQITRWALFLGESPYVPGLAISRRAQDEGIREAADWFLADSKAIGDIGEHTHLAISRLGGLLRRLRFADKPIEVSLCAFSTDRQALSASSRRVLDACVVHGLLKELPAGTPHRNSGALHHKYQLSPMLAPRFDLPTARRGVIPLSAEEMNGIFGPNVSNSEFGALVERRLATVNYPFRLPRSGINSGSPEQLEL